MIQLFKQGTTHVVGGTTCEMATVSEFGFEHLLEQGWHFKPEDCYPKESPEEPKELEKPKTKAKVKKLGKTDDD